MNILIVHNSYQQRGGEDVVVAAETALLQSAGHHVHTEIVASGDIVGLAAKANVFLHSADNPRRADWLGALLRRTGAEIVHIHNFFPLLTPAIHRAAADRGVAVVQTLHNYRLLCGNGLFLRNGQVCEKCLGHGSAWGALHRCYRGSLPGSLAVTVMQQRAQRQRTWHRHVHRFIALSDFARDKFVAGGLPADRITVKPNFAVPAPTPIGGRNGALFVGRLSPEKGAHILIEAWRQVPEYALTIIGDGPERAQLQALAPPNVTFVGALPPDAVRAQMLAAQYLILPSLCYEGFPIVIAEAFTAGLPVLASRLGSMIEIIQDGANGGHFPAGQPHQLAATVNRAFANPQLWPHLSAGARASYDRLYTPAANLAKLETIYAEALVTAKAAPAI